MKHAYYLFIRYPTLRTKPDYLISDEIIYIANISKPKYVFMSSSAYDVHYKTLKDHNTIKQYFIYGKDKGRADVICFEEVAGKLVDMELYKGANFYGELHGYISYMASYGKCTY